MCEVVLSRLIVIHRKDQFEMSGGQKVTGGDHAIPTHFRQHGSLNLSRFDGQHHVADGLMYGCLDCL